MSPGLDSLGSSATWASSISGDPHGPIWLTGADNKSVRVRTDHAAPRNMNDPHVFSDCRKRHRDDGTPVHAGSQVRQP